MLTTLLLLSQLSWCTSQPEDALTQFRSEIAEATRAVVQAKLIIVTLDPNIPWKAVTYVGPRTTEAFVIKVQPSWVCSASKEEMRWVARHEACHILKHRSLLLSSYRKISEEERSLLEEEAEKCVRKWELEKGRDQVGETKAR